MKGTENAPGKKLVVAIDGPAGAGKSTVAKLAAERLGFVYIDTGAMYRAIAWSAIKKEKTGSDALIVEAAEETDVVLRAEGGRLRVLTDGADVTDAIRSPEVTALVSRVAMLAPVREKLVAMQRKMAEDGGVVMDGRDIASHVLPDADVKIFLTASPDERAHRRWLETREKGEGADLARIKADIMARDKADSEREISPLVRVPEAELLDTTGMSVEEVVGRILDMCDRYVV